MRQAFPVPRPAFWLAFMATVAAPAWGQMHRCLDAAGKVSFSDTACSAGQTQVNRTAEAGAARPALAVKGQCAPWLRRPDHELGGPAVTFKLPDERPRLLCEIEHSRKNLTALQSDLDEYLRLGRSATPGFNTEYAALSERAGASRAAMAREHNRLAQLLRQLDGAAPHAQALGWSDRCSHWAVSRTPDPASADQRCKAERRQFFGY